ncbi:hypothetical protein C8R43DRAFT_1030434 [Mycena crocata]|nr:hypothetical protein C8R43DRAFT_1030434 [Mycena crocata]
MPLEDESPDCFASLLLPTGQQTKSLHELLRSNSLPHEPSHFLSVIRLAPTDLTSYDEEITRLQAHANGAALNGRLSDQMVARLALQKYSNGCHSLFSRVRRVPTEILTEIFTLCAPEVYPYYSAAASDHTSESALERAAQLHLLRLSQVCASWYTIVMNTPSLWATIEVDTEPDQTSFHSTMFIHLLSLSLQRSADYPLTISLRAEFILRAKLQPHAGPCINLLALRSHRWRSADLFLEEDALDLLEDVLDSLAPAATGNFPLLERLDLARYTLDDLDIFEIAPKLTKVNLGEPSRRPPILPWRQLQSIAYAAVPEESLICRGLGLLRHCSELCEFQIDNLWFQDVATISQSELTPVESDIWSLNWTIFSPDRPDHARQALGDILGTLTLPCLKRLSLDSTQGNNPPLFWPHDQFIAFASRSGCSNTLISLSLHNMVITESELVQCLSVMASLEVLFIQDVPSKTSGGPDHILITDGLLRQLFWTADATCLIPSLARFSFESLFTFDKNVLLGFIASRLTSGRTFAIELLHLKDVEEQLIAFSWAAASSS